MRTVLLAWPTVRAPKGRGNGGVDVATWAVEESTPHDDGGSATAGAGWGDVDSRRGIEVCDPKGDGPMLGASSVRRRGPR